MNQTFLLLLIKHQTIKLTNQVHLLAFSWLSVLSWPSSRRMEFAQLSIADLCVWDFVRNSFFICYSAVQFFSLLDFCASASIRRQKRCDDFHLFLHFVVYDVAGNVRKLNHQCFRHPNTLRCFTVMHKGHAGQRREVTAAEVLHFTVYRTSTEQRCVHQC